MATDAIVSPTKAKPVKPTAPTTAKQPPVSKSKAAKLAAQAALEAQQQHEANIALSRTILLELIDSAVTQYEDEMRLENEVANATSNAVKFIVDVIDFNTRQRYDSGETNMSLWHCEAPPQRCQIDSWAKNVLTQNAIIG